MANLYAIHAEQITLQVKDMQLVWEIRQHITKFEYLRKLKWKCEILILRFKKQKIKLLITIIITLFILLNLLYLNTYIFIKISILFEVINITNYKYVAATS